MGTMKAMASVAPGLGLDGQLKCSHEFFKFSNGCALYSQTPLPKGLISYNLAPSTKKPVPASLIPYV